MAQLRQTGSKELLVTCVAREKDVLKFWGLQRNAIEVVKNYESHFHKAASEFEKTSGYLSSNQLPLGVRCAVFSQIKRQWCRARVLDIIGLTEILVELMDYGNRESVTVDNVRHLDESFFRFPAQVIECILADVVPFNKREWSAEAVRFCEEELLYQTVSCYAISELMNVPVVRIAKKGENEPFVQRLINSGLAAIKPESAKPQVHQQPTLQMQPSMNQTFYGYKMNRLDLNTVHLVKISYIESMHKFYIQLAAAEAELRRLMDDIKVYTNSENVPFVNAPNVNIPCLAPFSSKQMYYRGVITSVSQGRCLVLFVDYGCVELKEFQELRAIPSRYLALQAQAIKCCLQTPIQMEAEDFFRVAKSGLMNCHVVGFNGDAYVVRLKEHVPEMMMQQPNALSSEPVSYSRQEVVMPQQNMSRTLSSEPISYPRQEMHINSSYSVTVSYVNDVTEFYCQLSHFKEKLDNISAILNSGYANQDFIALSECVPGMPVCVKFSEDNTWYRAQIVKVIHEADIEVFFVDFGNYDNANLKDIRRMKPTLINIPVMAHKCSLFEFDSPEDSTLKDEIFDFFEELTTGQPLTVNVKAVQEGPSYAVILQEENATSSINQKLQAKFSSVGSVPVLSVERLYVTSFMSPDSFFAQFEKLSSKKLEDMQNDINTHYHGARNASFKPKVGNYVCAKFHMDQQFYRAKVESVSGASCQVVFIDYGNREMVSFNDIHQLEAKFIKEPQFGIDCGFESCPPATPVEKLNSLMLENLIEARMIREQDKKWVIGLTEDFPQNVAILELLRQHETLVPRSIHGAGLRGFQENLQREEKREPRSNFQSTPKPDYSRPPQRGNDFGSRQNSISSPPKNDDEVQSFQNISVPPKAYRNVFVSHVVSPSEFYCQIEEESVKLQVLMKEIEDTYMNVNDNELRLKNMVKDSPCCAVFQEDGLWYRGQIKRVDSKSCTVYFIDYGNTDIVPVSKVKQLSGKFFTLPPQAICCKSYNVLPKGSTWSDQAIDDFINMTLGKSFVAQFVESDNKNVYAVNMVSIGKLQDDVLNKEFVTLGHGHLEDSSKTIVLNSHAASSNLTYQYPDVKIGSLEPVTVTYGLNPGEIFVQLKAYESEFKKMMIKLQAYYSKVSEGEALVDRPHQGMICVAQFFLDSAWYRGEIKKVEKNSLTISYVDYGNCEIVDRKKIRCISQDFTLLPVQGVKCRLKDVKSFRKSGSSENISKYFEGDGECRFVAKEGDSYLIDLVCNKKRVAELLVRDGIAESDVSVQPQGKVTSQPQVQPLLKRESTFVSGQLITVTVSFVHNPYKFWCQLADESDVLDQLMADIETQYQDYSQSSNAFNLGVGDYCVAKYSDDDAWYRAQIKSKVSAEEYEVFFIDYGNSEVSSVDRLGIINPDLLKLPPQCFECRLPGASENCDTKKTEEFQSIVDEAEEITAKIEGVTNGVYLTSLLYEKEAEELNVSIVLFGENFEIRCTTSEDVPKFLPCDVPLGSQEGYVTVVNTPHDFYIQLDGCEDNLTELSTELSENCENLSGSESSVTSPSLGYACAAKFSEDNNWYRAEIIGIHETTADVLFVDYGNVNTVPINTLKTLSKKLLDVPPYAIKCKLNGITSSAENWTQSAINSFQEMVVDMLLGVTFISKDVPAIVNISKDDKDVAQSLIELELAIVDTCPETEEAYADDHLVTVEDQLHSLPTDLSYPNRKLSSSKLPVKISYVDSYDKFYVMPLELSTELDTVMKTLEILYGSGEETEDSTREGIPDTLEDPISLMPCVAKYSEDEAWYRAIITDISKNDIHVTFIDYGNSEITSLENLKPLTPELIKIPPIAIECKLYGIQACKGREQEISAKLEEYYLDEVELDMEIVKKKEVYEIKLSNNGNFADLLCSEGLAIEVVTTSEIIESLTEIMNDNVAENLKTAFVEISEDSSIVVPMRSLSGKEQVNVMVKFAEMKEKNVVVYAVPNELDDELAALQELLQSNYNDSERKVSQVKCNDFCAAKYLEDDSWYRGQVLSCTGDEIQVKFIDYGNSAIVDINNIRELLPEFACMQQFAFAFCLTGFEAIEEMKDTLMETIDGQLYEDSVLLKLCKFTHKSPNICVTDIVCGEVSLVETLQNQKCLSQCYIEYIETVDKFEGTVECIVENLFYILPTKMTHERDSLRDILQSECCDTSASSDEIVPTLLYAAKVNECWSRVSISKIDHSSESALVKAVDYGTEVEVQFSQLRILPIDLYHHPVFLLPCEIVNLEDAPSNIKTKELGKLNNIIFQCEVQNPNSTPLAIKVFDKATVTASQEELLVGHNSDRDNPESDEFKASEIEVKSSFPDEVLELDTNNQCLTDDSKFELKAKESGENLCDTLNTDSEKLNLSPEKSDQALNDSSNSVELYNKPASENSEGYLNYDAQELNDSNLSTDLNSSPQKSDQTLNDSSNSAELDSKPASENSEGSLAANHDTQEDESELLKVSEDGMVDFMSLTHSKAETSKPNFGYSDVDSYNFEAPASETDCSQNNGDAFKECPQDLSDSEAELASTDPLKKSIESDIMLDESPSAINSLSESDTSLKCVETASTTKGTEGLDSDVESVSKDKATKNIKSDIELEDSSEEGELPSAICTLSESDASLKCVEGASASFEPGADEVYETQDSEAEDNEVDEKKMNELSSVSNPEGVQPVELNDSEKLTSLVVNENDWDERPECDIKQECKKEKEASESDSQAGSDSYKEVLDIINDSGNADCDDSKTSPSDAVDIATDNQSHSTLDAGDSHEQTMTGSKAESSIDAGCGDGNDPEVESSQVILDSEDVHNESSYLEDPSLHRLSGKVDVYIRDVAISNGSVLLAVTPYPRYLELENRLHEEFQAIYSTKEKGISDSSKLCAVLCDDSWYRGKILQLGDELTVLLIDYGLVKSVPISDAKELTPVHKEIPAYVVWCTLTHLHCASEKSNHAKEFLDSTLASIQDTGKIVSIEVIEEEEPYKVILFYEDDNLSYRLITENLAAQQLADIHVPSGQYSAKLSYIGKESDNLVYINLVTHLDDIKTLKISMECSYPIKDLKSAALQSDMYYAVLHDGVWMRGKAISLDEKLVLLLIDTGEVVSVSSDLCLLLPLHCLQSPFAIPCQIPDKFTKSEKVAEELNKNEFLVTIESSELQLLCAKITDENLIERLAHLEQSGSEQADVED